MHTCEICGYPADENDDGAFVPALSKLDPNAKIFMCRDCAQSTFVDFEQYFEGESEDDDDLDPIFIEEMFGEDALEDEDDGELY